jgi:hypothetical protein
LGLEVLLYTLKVPVGFMYTVSKATINHPYFDGLYHLFVAKLGMVDPTALLLCPSYSLQVSSTGLFHGYVTN